MVFYLPSLVEKLLRTNRRVGLHARSAPVGSNNAPSPGKQACRPAARDYAPLRHSCVPVAVQSLARDVAGAGARTGSSTFTFLGSVDCWSQQSHRPPPLPSPPALCCQCKELAGPGPRRLLNWPLVTPPIQSYRAFIKQRLRRGLGEASPELAVMLLQPRLLSRTLQLPYRCVSQLSVRSFASVIQETEKPSEPASSTDPSVAFAAPPPTRGEVGVLVRRYKPRTPGVRHLRRPINDHLWKGRPVHKLTFPKRGQSKGGRNHTGRITVRHRGGGHKRRIRMVDFAREAPGPHTVERIEHDPGRTAHIALLRSNETRKLSYVLAADGLRAGDVIQSYMAGIPQDLWESMGGVIDPGVLAARTAWRGNCLPLHMIPVGTLVFNVGLRPGKGGQLCRSAGTFATVIAKGTEQQKNEERKQQLEAESGIEKVEQKKLTQREKQKAARNAEHVTIRLQSGEVRLIHKDCCATVGVASNPNYQYTQIGKAGRARWLGIRPTVRGVAMNAMDHPHGGGRGKSKGNVDPKSPWGIPTKSGYKTRPKRKVNKNVIVPRVRNQGKRRRGYN
ncbi:54S ribosomal protein RML2, mitochondrial [Talaromyces islandicus]|uniref:Large ribosomal subunit protein uL2m n=1 Tax=Talaromyces islandicus TaxID=28573 RepID=A0A0U1LR92_TALIS|nr:54S ribosomal protein RML2, mitochondrial [Talaromyces islandicus]